MGRIVDHFITFMPSLRMCVRQRGAAVLPTFFSTAITLRKPNGGTATGSFVYKWDRGPLSNPNSRPTKSTLSSHAL